MGFNTIPIVYYAEHSMCSLLIKTHTISTSFHY